MVTISDKNLLRKGNDFFESMVCLFYFLLLSSPFNSLILYLLFTYLLFLNKFSEISQNDLVSFNVKYLAMRIILQKSYRTHRGTKLP
jgi:hypothetical protein